MTTDRAHSQVTRTWPVAPPDVPPLRPTIPSGILQKKDILGQPPARAAHHGAGRGRIHVLMNASYWKERALVPEEMRSFPIQGSRS